MNYLHNSFSASDVAGCFFTLNSFRGCAIQLEDMVVISDRDGLVMAYNLSGPVEALPSLNTVRRYHACGHYVNSQNSIVSVLRRHNNFNENWNICN